MKATSYGLINGVSPDGKPFDSKLGGSGDHAKNIFVGENLCAAMTFIYHGRRDTGLEISRRLYHAVAVKNRSPWNQRCLINGETGMPQWGTRLLLRPGDLGPAHGARRRVGRAVCKSRPGQENGKRRRVA